MKHRRGYYKGKYTSYLLTAYVSYLKSTELQSNRTIAENLGISLRTFYRIKTGKISKRSKYNTLVKDEITKHLIYNNMLSNKGRIIYLAIEKIRQREGKRKSKDRRKRYKIEELTINEMNKIKDKALKKIETYIETFADSHYAEPEE